MFSLEMCATGRRSSAPVPLARATMLPAATKTKGPILMDFPVSRSLIEKGVDTSIVAQVSQLSANLSKKR